MKPGGQLEVGVLRTQLREGCNGRINLELVGPQDKGASRVEKAAKVTGPIMGTRYSKLVTSSVSPPG